MLYTVKVKEEFDAAHFLKSHPGKCRKLHGHRWVVEMELQFDVCLLPKSNMLVDFGDLKDIVGDLDHISLNDIESFEGNPTAEAIATWISDKLVDPFYNGWLTIPPDLVKITVHESPGCSVTVETHVRTERSDADDGDTDDKCEGCNHPICTVRPTKS